MSARRPALRSPFDYPHLLRHGIHPEHVIGAEETASQGGVNFRCTTLLFETLCEAAPTLAKCLFGNEDEKPLLETVTAGASAVHVFDPSTGRFRTGSEACLPNERDAPWTGLWQVQRPGR